MHYFELDRDLGTNKELALYLKSLKEEDASLISSEKLGKDPWVLTVGQASKVLALLDKIFQGLATGKDDVYFIYNCVDDGEYIVGESKWLERQVRIERGLVKPLLKGEDVHRYDTIETNRYAVLPYKNEDGENNLYKEEELSALFPIGYAYLKECEEALRGREHGRFDIDGEWFQFARKQGLANAEFEKLVAPEISYKGNFSHDKDGEFYSTTKIYGYIKKSGVKESYKFWMGLLNSQLFWFFIQNTGYVLRGGYYTFKTNYVTPFPIPDSVSKEADNAISILTDYMVFIKAALQHSSGTQLCEEVNKYFQSLIDGCIYELYFHNHMKEAGIEILESVICAVKPITQANDNEKESIIMDVYNATRNSELIGKRIEQFVLRSPEILKPIIEG